MGTTVNPTLRGPIAQVPDDLDVNTWSAKAEVRELVDFVQNKYNDLTSSLSTIQNDLLDLMQSFDIVNVESKFEKLYTGVTVFPSDRAWGELILNNAWPTELPIKPRLKDFGNINYEYIEPVPPGEFNASFSWVGQQYTSELRTALAAAIYNELVNGGYGLPQSVHTALIEKERNARLRNQASQTRSALLATGESGFLLGMGSPAQRGIIAEATKAQVYSDQDALNAVTEIDFNTYQKNKEFFHSLAVELEKLRSGEWDQGEQRRFEADRTAFELASRAVEVNLEVYKKKWEGIKIGAETMQTRVEAIASQNNALNNQYIAEWDAYKKRVEGVAAENTAKIQIRGLEVDIWSKEVAAAATKQEMQLKKVEFDFRQMLAEIEHDLKIHEINTDGYKIEADLKNSILSSLSKIIAQVVASTIGAMNASASMGFSGSESISRSLNDSASISESYSGQLQE